MQFWRNNGLSIVLLALFALTFGGQWIAGWLHHNEEQRQHHQPQTGLFQYLGEGNFWEATGENWESEFLQMAMYLILTATLFQKGSAESKDPGKTETVDMDPRLSQNDPEAPWPVRKGGWWLKLYSHSLSIAFALLFFLSMWIHAAGGASEYSQEQLAHGEQAVSVLQYLGTSRFWFESFQNWQSEFLSLAAMVILSIFLRQKGSPESKPVAVAHSASADDEPHIAPGTALSH